MRYFSGVLLCFLLASKISLAQGFQQIGSASSFYSTYENECNFLTYDPDLNTVVFIHRNNPNVFGGNASTFRYDVSTDTGSTWQLNLGPLNTSITENNQVRGRHPQVAIYNPSGNTNPANAYLGYFGSFHNDPGNGIGSWNGIITGVAQLNGNASTITEDTLMPFNGETWFATSLTRTANNTFWAISPKQQDNLADNKDTVNGIILYKGLWNNGLQKITWTDTSWLNFPYPIYSDSSSHRLDFSIAFDPTGKYGWIACSGDYTLNFNFYPLLFSSPDSGKTWYGPKRADLTNISSVTNWMSSTLIFPSTQDTVTTAPTIAFESDLAVDAFGNPHFFAAVGHTDFPYGIYPEFGMKLYDFSYSNNAWSATVVDSLKTHRGRTAPLVGGNGHATQDNRPQIAVNPDGTKLFYTWIDSDPSLSPSTDYDKNNFPNLLGKMYDLGTQTFSSTYNFTWGSQYDGKVFYYGISPTFTFNNSTNDFFVPAVFAKQSTGANDFSPVDYIFCKLRKNNNINSIISESNQSSIRIFPVPTKENLNLEFKKEIPQQIVVSTIQGQKLVVINEQLASFYSMSTANWAKGMYLISFLFDNAVVTKKVVVE